MPESFSFFATCPKGLESLLEQELLILGAESCRASVAGVAFTGDIRVAYTACLWSRLANRVLLRLVDAPIQSGDDLYDVVKRVDWRRVFSPEVSFHVVFSGTNTHIRHTLFGAQRVKDAVVDYFTECGQARPSIDFTAPDIQLYVHLSKRNVSVSLNLSGESLHKRGYRCRNTPAPLKENLAAALLVRAGYHATFTADTLETEFPGLVDPMCGSGTLLIEAGFMCTDRAPGLARALTETEVVTDKGFGFAAWQAHDPVLWHSLVEAAKMRFERGLSAAQKHVKHVSLPQENPSLENAASENRSHTCSSMVWIRGFDVHPNAVAAARANVQAAGLASLIHVECCALESLSATQLAGRPEKGLVIVNPPYGERLGDRHALEGLYPCLGQKLKALFTPWQAAVFTGNRDLAGALRLRAKRKYRLFNGTIDSELLLFDLLPATEARLRESYVGQVTEESLSDGARMVLNRLRKNAKGLRRWLAQTEITCYRLYDADMPEYACAIDVYGEFFHVQEYAAPKQVAATQAAKRFQEVVAAVSVYAQVPIEAIVTKVRRRQAKESQYERLETPEQSRDRSDFFTVREGRALLQVNLRRYLDVGLFLDHRPIRRTLFETANGKRFLNLFCYTASATVQAALGGAVSSVSVDMSKTYLRWAAENFALNNMDSKRHRLVNDDCLAWLKTAREVFDVILLDPPTFSNSKKMTGVLDVQRDHVALIRDTVSHLAPGGILYFSTNQRTFTLDEAALTSVCVFEEISAQTKDPDFSRNPKIHRCWRITCHPL